MAKQWWLLISIFAALVLGSCTGVHPVADLLLRNDSTQPVTVSVETPPGQLLSSSRQVSLQLPPWHAGLCPYAGLSVMVLPISVTVSGPGVVGPATTKVSPNPPDVVFVLVDASGKVAFRTAREPVQSSACDPYQFMGR